MKLSLIILIICLNIASSLAKDTSSRTEQEQLQNFSVVYAGQWITYYFNQKKTIKEQGSFSNWRNNFIRPHMDLDDFGYNVVGHTFTGAGYFLWYRNRGYTDNEAYAWSWISSLAFEFTIEPITERPSIQDIVQTPLFGTALGKGLEHASLYFHSLDNWYGHLMGYFLNPFTLLPGKSGETNGAFVPVFSDDSLGVKVSYRFE